MTQAKRKAPKEKRTTRKAAKPSRIDGDPPVIPMSLRLSLPKSEPHPAACCCAMCVPIRGAADALKADVERMSGATPRMHPVDLETDLVGSPLKAGIAIGLGIALAIALVGFFGARILFA